MYQGKSIRAANAAQYRQLNQILIKNEIDLSNPPNPYNLIKEEQQKDRQKNKKSNIPYNWVRSTVQPLNNSNSFQDPNASVTISRNEMSRQGFSREFNQSQNSGQANLSSMGQSNSLSSTNYNPRPEWSSNQNNNNTFQRNIASSNHTNQRSLSFIEELFDDDSNQNNQIKYEQINFDQPIQRPPIQYIKEERPFQNKGSTRDFFKKQEYKRQQIKEERPYQNKVRARDIFKKQEKKEEKQHKGNQTLCGLTQCNPNKKLTALKILQPIGPLVRNYEMGDARMWQINSKYPDHVLREALRNFPHIKEFKNNQKAVIKCALNGNDVFVCIPTGGGKSLIFQIMTFIKKGIYLCILPLISLIYDQQMQAQNFNIEAYSLTGATNGNKVKQVYAKLASYTPQKKSILIFCTPEKISLSQNFIEILTNAYYKGYLQHVIIDQVHCVSTWGKEFRKEYENLSQVKVFFPKTPILALTATVTETVKQQIIKKLKLTKCNFFQSSFNRPNLMYQVLQKSKKSAIDEISSILADRKNQSGIIYCLSKKECQEMCKNLNNRSYRTAFYHADLHDNDKRQIQQMWMDNKIKIIIATIAFGMGINKPDVRFVIHNSLSKSLQNYYQESGRAGRDGFPAKCILFYQRSDRTALQTMILKNDYSSAASKMFSNRQLAQMVKYCEEKYICRRQFQLNYLGQKDFDPSMCQKTCDNCIKGRKFKEFQCIQHGKEIVKFLHFVHDKKDRITKTQMIAIFKSKSNKSNKNVKVFNYPSLEKLHELFKYWTIDQLQEILLELLSQEVLKETVVTTNLKKIGNVSNVYIECNLAKCHKFMDKVQTLPMRRQVKPEKFNRGPSGTINRENIFDELFGDQDGEGFFQQKQTGSQIESMNPSDSYEQIDFGQQEGIIDYGQFEYNQSYDERANEIRMENSSPQMAKIEMKTQSKDEARAKMFDYLSDLFDDQQQQI